MIPKLIGIALLAMAAGIVQSVSGFGNAIVMMLGFPSFFGITQAASVSGSIGIFNNAILAFQHRKKIHFRKTVIITAIYTVASMTSIHLASGMNKNAIGLIYGIFLILLAAYLIFLNGKMKLLGPFWMVFSSVVSGIGAGLFSIGGPLMAVYYNQLFDEREEYLGNLQFSFLIGACISMITRIVKGIYTVDLIPYTLMGILFIYIGQRIGNIIADKLKASTIKIVIYALVLISGIMTVLKYIR